MSNTKKNVIFNLNNILLSALGSENKFSKSLIAENNKYIKYVDENLKKEFKHILKGSKITYKPSDAPNETLALVSLPTNPAISFWEYARLLKKDKSNLSYIVNISKALLQMKAYNVILKHYVPKLEKYADKNMDALEIVAGTYFGIPEYYEKAIPLYEKYLSKVNKDEFGYYFRLAYLYERVYQDKNLDIQIGYAKKALDSYPNVNMVYALLAKMYYRKGEKDTCKKYLDKIMDNNPNADDKVIYSRFLMKEGKITEGYDLYRCRFETGNVAYPDKLLPEKRWNGKSDLSNSTVIIHYEQGFGDSVMFSRYIPEIAKKAGKVIFVVQKSLIPLLKSSGYDKYCEILSHEADINMVINLKEMNKSVMYSAGSGMARIPHDYHIPLMDMPYLIGENPDRMTEANGYLMADVDKVNEFRKKYITKNKKIKIGLAYHGTKESILTYRDISVKKFLPLFNLKGVEFYSFQADEYAKELEDLDKNIKIINLGKEFKDFEDTACALNCMDVLISTDNVVMNLAGALGIKTYGLFNVISESRWFKTEGEDIGWYKSVKPFRAKTFNDWDNLIKDIMEQLKEDFSL